MCTPYILKVQDDCIKDKGSVTDGALQSLIAVVVNDLYIFFPLFFTDCRYVAVDLPGHGLSSHRPPGVFYMFTAYVADLRRIIDGV